MASMTSGGRSSAESSSMRALDPPLRKKGRKDTRTNRDRRNAAELPGVSRGWQASDHLIEDSHHAEPELRVYDVPDPNELDVAKRSAGVTTSEPRGPLTPA